MSSEISSPTSQDNDRTVNEAFKSRVAVGSALGVLALGLAAWAASAPLLSPPLGVSIYSGCRSPLAPENRARNVFAGHVIGLLAGCLALVVCGGLRLPNALVSFDLIHVAASALAVGGTAGATARLRVAHPPALATTLLASLGLLPTLTEAMALLAGATAVAGSLAWAQRHAQPAEQIDAASERSGER